MSSLEKTILKLHELADSDIIPSIGSFGVPTDMVLGIRSPTLRKLAKDIGRDHTLALQLWGTNIHEAKLLATYLADPNQMTLKQAELWVDDLYSWDICDSLCRVFADCPFGYQAAVRWSSSEEEFTKRAGFVTMVNLSIHDKGAPDQKIEKFFPYLISESRDERNFVRKAVNWALRQIGKRSIYLNEKAVEVAHQIKNQGTRSAKWIANDALRELTSKAVIDRLIKKPINNC